MRVRDLTGQKFGRLTAIRRVESKPGRGQARWLFACDCGNEIERFGFYVVHKGQKSCGCYAKENPAHLKHGKTGGPGYAVWAGMRQRCQNPNSAAFRDYGGRGIVVCERWSKFENFIADRGQPPPGMSLDRKDNDGPYSPENCHWASKKTQVRNRRVTTMYTYQGETKSLPEWAEHFSIPYPTLWVRYSKMGWRDEKLFSPLGYTSKSHRQEC